MNKDIKSIHDLQPGLHMAAMHDGLPSKILGTEIEIDCFNHLTLYKKNENEIESISTCRYFDFLLNIQDVPFPNKIAVVIGEGQTSRRSYVAMYKWDDLMIGIFNFTKKGFGWWPPHER